MVNHTILVFILILLCSCAQRISIRTPSARFITPETQGEFAKGEFFGFFTAGTKAQVSLKDNKTSNALLLTNGSYAVEEVSSFNAMMGLTPKADFIIINSGRYTPVLYGLKYQLYGRPRTKREIVGLDHSVAITMAVGTKTQKQKDANDNDLTLEEQDSTIKLNHNTVDFGILYGYRFQYNQLVYTGISHTNTTFSGSLDSDNTNLDGKKLIYTGRLFGYQLGYVFEATENINIKLEASLQRLYWDKTRETDFAYLSGGLGFNW